MQSRVTTPAAGHDVSDFSRNVREVTACIGQLQARDLTAADRAALRSLLAELETFVRSVKRRNTLTA